jgi:asparagine synthase (glutamine-hydrolysing)
VCGICGVLGFSAEFATDAPLVRRMADLLHHRGPDDGGTWSNAEARVALGNRRLAIVDLSPQGHQPMTNEDGSLWITFNGEIYNHGSLRQQLEARGHRYRSRTDTETILHLYEEEGARCVQRLEGMFAFALWDGRERRLLLVRDRLGVKPLYFHHTVDGLVFASEIKCLLQHPAVRRELDEEAFYHFLTFGCVPQPATLFRGVRKLGPAELMEVAADGRVRLQTYWTPFSPAVQAEVRAMPDEEQERRLLDLLRASVKKRMMADVQFGVFLSGGVDSSTNVALMADLMDRPVRTYSVGFSDTALADELPHAERVAQWFGTAHRTITLDDQALFDALPKLAYHQDEPVADWVSVPLYYLGELARTDGTVVVQVGEGADELLHGYEMYARATRLERRYTAVLARMPSVVGAALARGSDELLVRLGRGHTLGAFVSESARRRLPFWGGHVAFREFQKARLMPGSADWGMDSHDVVARLWAEALELDPALDRLQHMTYLDMRHRLAELLLMRVDKMTMASSVEAREPFLDHHFVEFAMALPARMKVGDYGGKHILKRAVADLLPPGIATRAKQGFSAPVSSWFRRAPGQVVREQMAASSLRERGLLDWREVDRLWDAHRGGNADWGVQLWTLLNACLWHDAWIADHPH